MVASCGARCMKYSLVFFNTIFLVFGLCLIALGAYVFIMVDAVLDYVVSSNDVDLDYKTNAKIGAIIFLAAGAIMVIVCIFGCCGACRERKWMLGTFAILLGIVIIAKLVFVVKLFMVKAKVDSNVTEEKDKFRSGIRRYRGGLAADDHVDFVQQTWRCCGSNSWKDFGTNAKNWPDRYSYKVPLSCCLFNKQDSVFNINDLQDPNCPTNPTKENSFIDTPCNEHFETSGVLCLLFIVTISVCFGLIALELIAAAFATCLISMIGVPY